MDFLARINFNLNLITWCHGVTTVIERKRERCISALSEHHLPSIANFVPCLYFGGGGGASTSEESRCRPLFLNTPAHIACLILITVDKLSTQERSILSYAFAVCCFWPGNETVPQHPRGMELKELQQVGPTMLRTSSFRTCHAQCVYECV